MMHHAVKAGDGMRFDKKFWLMALMWSAIFLVVARLIVNVPAQPFPPSVLGIALALGIVAVAASAVGLLITWGRDRRS